MIMWDTRLGGVCAPLCVGAASLSWRARVLGVFQVETSSRTERHGFDMLPWQRRQAMSSDERRFGVPTAWRAATSAGLVAFVVLVAVSLVSHASEPEAATFHDTTFYRRAA